MAVTTKGATGVEAILGGTRLVYGRIDRRGALQRRPEGLPTDLKTSPRRSTFVRESSIIGVASRTLARAQHDASAVESDRLVGIAQIATLAEATLGSREHVRRWLRQPNRALGGVTPLACLDTEPGRRQIEATLYQIRYGMIS
jgi:putative toxin-antitoxin system antitoxin component (TIGR02293 family)